MNPLKRNAGPRLALALVAMILLACPAAHADYALAPPGLVSWYQAAGNALDSVGTNHGTLTGSAGFTNGIVGQSFVLDGLDGGVNLGNVPAFDFTPDSSFSIEAWFDSFGIRTSGNDGQLIVALNNQCGNEAQALVMGNNVSEFGVVKFLVRDVNGLFGLAVSPAAASNQFHHVVGVRDVNGVVKTLRLYLDGVLVDAGTSPATSSMQNSSCRTLQAARRSFIGCINPKSPNALSIYETPNPVQITCPLPLPFRQQPCSVAG